MSINLFEIFGTIAIKNVGQAQSDIDETGSKAAKFGETLKKGITTIGKWGAAIGTAAVGAATALTKMATSSAATADNVDKMSQKIGISRDAYQELEFICSQSGTTVDMLQTGMKTLTAAMDGAASGTKSNVEQFEKLGVAVTNSDGSLRNQEDVLFDTMSALQKMDNQTEKARLATELFGRSGTELMPLLNGAAGSIDEMKKQAHDLGLVLDDETIDSGVELTDTMDQMKRAIGSLVTRLGGSLMPIVTKLCNFIIKNLPTIEKIIKQITPVLQQIFDELLPTLMELASELLPVIVDLAMEILPIISEMAKKILPIFAEILQTIMPPLVQIVEAVLPVLQNVLSAIMPLFEALTAVLTPVLNVVTAILNPITSLAEGLTSVLADAFDFLFGKTNAAVQAAWDEANALIAIKNEADAARQAVDEKAAAELGAVTSAESLWKELNTLADSQGKVAEKDKKRAEFITTQLSEALGIEIGWTGNQIQNYKDLRDEIDETIEKKKAEILLTASEEKYKLAIEKVTKAEEERTNAMREYTEASEEVERIAKTGAVASKQYNDALENQEAKFEALKATTGNLKDYYSDISQYETAQTYILQGETDKAVNLLSNQGEAFKKASELAGKSAEEQQKILKDQLDKATASLASQTEMYNTIAKTGTEEQKKTAENALNNAREYFAKSAKEYKAAGGEIGSDFFKGLNEQLTSKQIEAIGASMIDGLTSGAKANKTKLMIEMAQIMNEALSSGGVSVTTATTAAPKMAKGGILKKGQVGFLEGDGAEAVVPLEKNTEWIDRVASKLNNGVGNNTDITSKLDELIRKISSMNIVLDTGIMVGEMAPAMDAQLGDIYAAKERGR